MEDRERKIRILEMEALEKRHELLELEFVIFGIKWREAIRKLEEKYVTVT